MRRLFALILFGLAALAYVGGFDNADCDTSRWPGKYFCRQGPATLTGPAAKLSRYGICHAKGSTYYSQTHRYTSHASLADCLKAGGRLPKM